MTNMLVSIEQHVEWVVRLHRAHGGRRTSAPSRPTATPRTQWVDHVNQVASFTLYPEANSWYMGANVPGKPRVFMPYLGGVGPYRQICDEVVADGYRGFRLGR